MSLYSSSVRRLLDSWPGKRRFGIYRFLPLFFVLGAALEFSMIKWTVGETNFCECQRRNGNLRKDLILLSVQSTDRTFKRRQAKNYIEEQQQHHLAQPQPTATA